ncbi:hypothetical protein [Pedobacter immunditicola]|uniref:hypothetical protein n=1 Tax=Pedobacter immunditicola TaxID=3133440 RepID=UPI003095E2DE
MPTLFLSPVIIKKLKIFFIPFLITAFALCGIYSLLHWVLLIKFQLFTVKEIYVDVVGPVVLPWIPILFYFRPALKSLKLTTKKGNWIDFYTMMLFFILIIPFVMSQIYLKEATGKLTQLHNVNEISKFEPSKYYKIDRHFVHKSNIGMHTSFDVSGKYNNHFNMHIYIAMPIFAAETDTLNSVCLAWLGKEYQKTISNKLSAAEKQREYQTFSIESQNSFNKENFEDFIFLDRVGFNEDTEGFNKAIEKNQNYRSEKTAVFLAVNIPFEDRLGCQFPPSNHKR